MSELTPEQEQALRRWRFYYGRRRWKSALVVAWHTAYYVGVAKGDSVHLHPLRNTLGVSGLKALRLPEGTP